MHPSAHPCTLNSVHVCSHIYRYGMHILYAYSAQARDDPKMVERLVTQAKDNKGRDIYTRTSTNDEGQFLSEAEVDLQKLLRGDTP